MKIQIEATSQEEFDEKRPELIKAIAGSKFDVDLKQKGQRLATEPSKPFYKAQAEILEKLDKRFQLMLKQIRADIDEIIG